MFGNQKCSRCKGTGECQECYGTGKNTHLNVPGDLCEACKGSAKCQVCGGKVSGGPISKLLRKLSGE